MVQMALVVNDDERDSGYYSTYDIVKDGKVYRADFTINDGAAETNSKTVSLKLNAEGYTKYSIGGGSYKTISGLAEYEKCAATMINWQTGILNSFTVPYTNGFTEGCNNRIKVIKRISYGYRNFRRFRNRILHIFRYQHPNRYKTKVAA